MPQKGSGFARVGLDQCPDVAASFLRNDLLGAEKIYKFVPEYGMFARIAGYESKIGKIQA